MSEKLKDTMNIDDSLDISNKSNTQQNVNTMAHSSSKFSGQENKPLIEKEPIQGTPFHMVKTEDEKGNVNYKIVLGRYKMTQEYETRKECYEELDNEMWNKIFSLVIITHETVVHEVAKGLVTAEQIEIQTKENETH